MTARYLDLDALLDPIPGENPAGVRARYLPDWGDFDQARKVEYDHTDPKNPTVTKRADWGWVVRTGSKLLREQSKDLELAVIVVEAVTRGEAEKWPQGAAKSEPVTGFAALADGFALLRGLVERCWPAMHPADDPDDPEVRASPFNWLNDTRSKVRFPTTLRGLPLIAGPHGPIGHRDWFAADINEALGKDEQEQARAELKERCEKAVSAATHAQCQVVFDDLTRCIEQLTGLSAALAGKMGSAAPGLVDLRAAVADCYSLAKEFLNKKGGPTAPPGEDRMADPTGGGPGAAPQGSGGAASIGQVVASREGAYAALRQAADLLEKLEPHSPIPFLVKRAVALKDKTFPEMIKAFVRDTSALSEMNRELGIDESGGG